MSTILQPLFNPLADAAFFGCMAGLLLAICGTTCTAEASPKGAHMQGLDTLTWAVVNDTVMGGRSEANITWVNGRGLVWRGTLSLENNGGFVSIRTRDEFAELGSAFNRMIEGLAEKKRIRAALDKSVSRDVITSIMVAPAPMETRSPSARIARIAGSVVRTIRSKRFFEAVGPGIAAKLPNTDTPYGAFVHRCLMVDPYRRMSADAALRHPFMTEFEASHGLHFAGEDINDPEATA